MLSRYVDAIALRTSSHETLLALADGASVPVINALSDRSHPCQLVADVMTYEEHRGPIAGRTVAWLGDGNNMAATWVQTAAHCGFSLRLACPAAYPPPAEIVAWAKARGADVEVGTGRGRRGDRCPLRGDRHLGVAARRPPRARATCRSSPIAWTRR